MNAKPISESKPNGCSPVAIAFLGAVFLIGGLIGFWFAFINPVWSHVQAQQWRGIKCTITVSEIKKSSDSDGTTYRPVIKYRYLVDGQQKSGERISFTKFGSSSNRSYAKKYVKKYPVGTVANCYYDPHAPDRSVLEREFSHWIWIMLFPLVFVLVGAAMLVRPFRAGEKESLIDDPNLVPSTRSGLVGSGMPPDVQQGLSPADQLDLQWAVPQKLKPTSSRLGRAIGIGVFSLIWNGFIGFMAVNVLGGGFNFFNVFIFLFLIPFLLVGLLGIVGFFHQLLALFNPVVEVALSTGAVPVGGEFDIAWEIPHRSSRLRKLTIRIQGSESATYQQGTDTKTDTQLFANIPVVETTDTATFAFGSATITIPAETMHTFESRHNKILWQVKVHGEIAYWPDVDEQFAFRVKPAAADRL